MSDFARQRRQRYLSEAYYQQKRQDLLQRLDEAVHNPAHHVERFEGYDFYDVEKQPDWGHIAPYHLDLLHLDYAAGADMAGLAAHFDQFMACKEKEAAAICKALGDPRVPGILGGGSGDILPLISLAYLLNRREYLPVIVRLADGEYGGNTITDAATGRWLYLGNPEQLRRDYDADHALFNWADHWLLCKCLDEMDLPQSRDTLMGELDYILKEWYKSRRYEFWYNSHQPRRLYQDLAYVGYWEWSVAGLLYLLDWDDSAFHAYLYFPKDLMAWAKNRHPHRPHI